MSNGKTEWIEKQTLDEAHNLERLVTRDGSLVEILKRWRQAINMVDRGYKREGKRKKPKK